MKIHLITLMATDLDHDILGHWIDHYKNLDIDTYTVFIHEEKSQRHPECIERLKDNGFKVCPITFPARGIRQKSTGINIMSFNGEMRNMVFLGYAMAVPEHEYILSVDSDEFQQWPECGIKESMLDGAIHCMEGELIDRFSEYLKPAEPNLPLEIQYPNELPNLEYALYPVNEIKNLKRHKICCHRNDIGVEFGGSHAINYIKKETKGLFRSRDGLKVHHYKWRHTAYERLIGKPWWNESTIGNIIDAFKKSEVTNNANA